MKNAEISTSTLVVIVVALLTLFAVVAWSAPAINNLWKDINETAKRPVFPSESNIFQLEQSFNTPLTEFYIAWNIQIPSDLEPPFNNFDQRACVQELIPFGETFKFYNVELYVDEGGISDTVIFRISDFDDNLIASEPFVTNRELCIIEHDEHRTYIPLVSEDKNTFTELKITRNENILSRDSYTLTTVGENPISYEYNSEDFEMYPLMYLDENYACFVIGKDLRTAASNFETCKTNTLEEVSKKFNDDLKYCLASTNKEGCNCEITLLDLQGLQIEFNNKPGKVEVIIRNDTGSINLIYDVMMDMVPKEAIIPSVYSEPLGYRNYFSEQITYNNNLIEDHLMGEQAQFNQQFEIKDKKIKIFKPKFPESLPERQIFNGEEKENVWNYLIIKNDINNNLPYCKQ